jgi:hypothetical protein
VPWGGGTVPGIFVSGHRFVPGRGWGCLNGPVGCLVFSWAMQSRTPKLGWIAKVLADPDAPQQRAERAPLRLVSEGIRTQERGGIKPPTLVPSVRDRRSGGSGLLPRAGRRG